MFNNEEFLKGVNFVSELIDKYGRVSELNIESNPVEVRYDEEEILLYDLNENDYMDECFMLGEKGKNKDKIYNNVIFYKRGIIYYVFDSCDMNPENYITIFTNVKENDLYNKLYMNNII